MDRLPSDAQQPVVPRGYQNGGRHAHTFISAGSVAATFT
jgi:hypothetical protein